MAGDELVGPAPDGWEYTTLGVACQRGGGDIQTGPFGSQLHAADYVPNGVPSIMPQNIGDNRIVEESIARITPEDAKRLGRYLVRRDDIVYSRRGDVERRALVRDHEDGWLCGTGCLRVRLGDRGPDPRFVTYYLGHPSVREWIVRHAQGATMPNLNTSILGACPLLVPPPGDQRAIAHILGTLDDKIELNRRMSETLEAMARALFKSWFVDFDPVRAKAEGRDPGLPEAIAELFPDSFEDSELGEIPRGWCTAPLSELTSYLNRGIGPAYLQDGGICVLNQKCIRNHRIDLSKSRRHDATSKPVEGRTLRTLDILVNSTGVGTLGRAAQVWDIPEAAIVDSHVSIVRASKSADPTFLGAALTHREPDIQLLGEGSTGQTELSRERLGSLRLIVPPTSAQKAFGELVGPLFLRAAANQRETTYLSTLRDTLLPSLISGRLAIGNADRFIGSSAPSRVSEDVN